MRAAKPLLAYSSCAELLTVHVHNGCIRVSAFVKPAAQSELYSLCAHVQWDTHRRSACLAALLLPLRQLSIPKKKKTSKHIQPLSSYILSQALKLPNKECEQVRKLHSALPELCMIYDQVSGMPFSCWNAV